MKKYRKFLPIILLLIILLSCNQHQIQNGTTKTTFTSEGASFNNIKKFTFENHDYIMFITDGNYSATAGVVHNPECNTCKNEQRKSTISTDNKILE